MLGKGHNSADKKQDLHRSSWLKNPEFPKTYFKNRARISRCAFTIIYNIAKVLNVSIDTFAVDFEQDNSNIFLSSIRPDVENMSKKQLDMLRDSIETIKKYEF